jgi:hypothetical protein
MTFDKTPQGAEETETDTQFAEVGGGPANVGDLLPSDAPVAGGPNLLKAGATIGMVSQCSKNPNLQIRAEPLNPQGEAPRSESVIQPGPSTGLQVQ